MFDARKIKSLQPDEYITVSEYPGLRIRATETTRTWMYRYKSPIDGRMRQIKIGAWPSMSVHAAIADWEKLRQLRESGRDPALEAKNNRESAASISSRSPRVGRYTVSEVASDWLEGYVRHNRVEKGYKEVSWMFFSLIGDFGKIIASDLSRAQAFDLINGLAERMPVQAMKFRAALGSAWDYAIDAGRLPETTPNWWRLILRGKIKSKGKYLAGQRIGTQKRVLSADEVGTLLQWIENLPDLLRDGIIVYLWTGVRGSEIASIEGKDIRVENGVLWWTIPKSKTKNARHQNATDLRVPLFGKARDVFIRRKEACGDGFLFTSTREGKVTAIEQKYFQTTAYYYQPYCVTRPNLIRPRLPVTHWAPHDLRRTARTMLASIGCPDAVSEAILGHMQPGVMGIYNQYSYDKERIEWLKKLSDYLESLT